MAAVSGKAPAPAFEPRLYTRDLDFGVGPEPVWLVPAVGGLPEYAQATVLMHVAARAAYLSALTRNKAGDHYYDATQFMVDVLGKDSNATHLRRLWRGEKPMQTKQIAALLAAADPGDLPDADWLWEQLRIAKGLK